MKQFVGSTIGLECNGHGKTGKMIKVEYTRLEDGSVQLAPVSGRTLAKAGRARTVTAQQFSDRPSDPYDNVSEARWALKQCGWTLMADE